MELENLPDILFFPAVSVESGTISAQLKNESGDIAILAWGTSEKVISWLKSGGLQLWKNNEHPPCNDSIVVTSKDKASFFALTKGDVAEMKRYLHFEPDIGNTFAPEDRIFRL